MRDGSGMYRANVRRLKISVTERLRRHRPRVYSRKVAQDLRILRQLMAQPFGVSNYLSGAVFSVSVRRRRRLSQIAGVGSLVHR